MENEMKNSNQQGYNKGIGFGLVLMLVGVVFLGLNFGLIPATMRHIIISWPMLLIFIGVIHLFKRKLISGVVLLFLGGFFIIPRVMPEIDQNFVHTYWPLLLIGAGFVILIQRLFVPQWGHEAWSNDWHTRREGRCHRNRHHDYSKWGKSPDGFSKNSVFGGGDHIVLDPVFKGGELNAVFGGLTLDLRRTNLPEGETHLEVNAVFGGITIFVPSDWLIETHLDTVFGGFQDNRMPKEPLDPTRKLIIAGSCVFGGGEIRN